MGVFINIGKANLEKTESRCVKCVPDNGNQNNIIRYGLTKINNSTKGSEYYCEQEKYITSPPV